MAEDTKIDAAAPITVGLINASDNLEKCDKKELQNVVDALNIQVQAHFFPWWGKNATIELVENDASQYEPYLDDARKEWWWLVLADNSDRAGFFGYHDTTTEGKPLGIVFVKTALDFGREWSVTASHELLEMLTDPWLNMSAFKTDGTNSEDKGWFYAYDICDPCQEKPYWIHPLNKKMQDQEKDPSNKARWEWVRYKDPSVKEGWVAVSNFVYPAWFVPKRKPAQIGSQDDQPQYDRMKKIKQPFELLDGGYITVHDAPLGNGWYQRHQEGADTSQIFNWDPAVGSRRQRRMRRMSGNTTPSRRGTKVPPWPG